MSKKSAPTSLRSRAVLMTMISLGVMAIGSVGLDQISKIHAEENLMVWMDELDVKKYQGHRYPIWSTGPVPPRGSDDFYLALNFNYVRNLGAAWGLLSNLPDHIRTPFFYLVTLLAVVFIGFYMKSTPPHHRTTRFALGLILSGAIGNFIDRLRLGYVIDWIDVRWNIFGWRYDFPNFNVADSAISVGVFLLLIDMAILESLRRKREAAKTASATATE